MKPVKDFNEFVKEGIAKKQAPDKPRAEFLKNESEQNYNFLKEILNKIELTDKNANSIIKTCYDIIMELIRAAMLQEGYNATGQGAHEAEVSYMRNLKFTENEIQFADQLRYFRNGITYYGTILDAEYARKVIKFTTETREKLKQAMNQAQH